MVERRWPWTFLPSVGRRGAVLPVLGLVLLLAAPLLAPYAPHSQDLSRRLQPPSRMHLFGTDDLGRDVFSRVLHGAGYSAGLGLAAVLAGLSVGAPLGLVAGMCRGRADRFLARIFDIFLAFPAVLLALVIMAGLGAGLRNAVLAVGIVLAPRFARIARAAALSESVREYMEAARATGTTPFRRLWRHLLPNCLSPLLVAASLAVGTAMLELAALSFLGLGAQPPTPEWGALLAEGRAYLRTAPHLTLFPGLALFLTVLAFTLLGESLRERLNPRSTWIH